MNGPSWHSASCHSPVRRSRRPLMINLVSRPGLPWIFLATFPGLNTVFPQLRCPFQATRRRNLSSTGPRRSAGRGLASAAAIRRPSPARRGWHWRAPGPSKPWPTPGPPPARARRPPHAAAARPSPRRRGTRDPAGPASPAGQRRCQRGRLPAGPPSRGSQRRVMPAAMSGSCWSAASGTSRITMAWACLQRAGHRERGGQAGLITGEQMPASVGGQEDLPARPDALNPVTGTGRAHPALAGSLPVPDHVERQQPAGLIHGPDWCSACAPGGHRPPRP